MSVSDALRGTGVELLERRAELDLILALTQTAAGGSGRALLVEGPAGIGKTVLVQAARHAAEDSAMLTLDARGTELERDFGFGVMRQLFEPLVRDEVVKTAFAGRARPAAALLDVPLPGPPPEVPSGPEAGYVVLDALYWLITNLARRAPLALLIDDAHWSDPASLRFMSYLARRLAGLPVLLVVSTRPAGEPGGESVESLLHDAEITMLRPQPISEAATARIVRGALPDADDVVCQRCHTASGGNPFFLRELVHTLGQSDPADRVPEAVPRSVVAAVQARLARLPAPARELAHGLAIMGDGSLLRHAAQAVQLDDRDAAPALDDLVAAGILARDGRLRFLHPIIRAAVYEELPRGRRATAHERAAELLAAEDAAPERVAAHLLVSEPGRQPWVCVQLRLAAREGMRRGAPEAVVTYLRRALDEPPPARDRAELLLELGEAEALTLDATPAAEHLRRGIDGIGNPEQRLTAALLLAGVLGMDGRSVEAVDVLERALVDSQAADPGILARVNAHLVNVARHDVQTRSRSLPRASRLRRDTEQAPNASGVELTAAAGEEAMAGDSADRTAELAERALTRLAAEGTAIVDYTIYTAARCLIVADRLPAARAVFDRLLDQAREQGAVVATAGALAFRSEVHLRTGELQAAQADAQAAFEIMRKGWRIGLPATMSYLAQVLIEREETDAAESAIQEGGLAGPADSIGSSYPMTMLLHARGGLRLAQGRSEAALEDLLEVGRRQTVMREPNPASIDWRSLAATALSRLGPRDEAMSLAEEEVRLARRFGAPRALGIALRAQGVVAGPIDGRAPLIEAEAVLAGSPARLAHAHALMDLGSAMLHEGDRQAAKDALTRALATAHGCGAAALEHRATAELHAAGARPRRAALTGPAALTASERRVTQLATQGLTNREIADKLFVTDRTVEFHLTSAFRKLNIHGRYELAQALADGASNL